MALYMYITRRRDVISHLLTDNQVWTNGYGTADFSTGKQVDGQSIFNIGSVTKSFTATLLAILLKENG